MMEEGPAHRVVVVEDDADTRANLCDILELDGYATDALGSFAEALAHERWDRTLAVILDRKLSDGTAEELLPRLRSLAPQASVIVVTGYPDLEGAIEALRQGASDYLLKPVNPEALRATLGRIASHRRMREAKERAEAALRQQRDFAESLIEAAQAIVLVLDTEGRIVRFNPFMERLCGYALDEVWGRDWFETFLPGPDRERLRRVFAQTLGEVDTSGTVNAIVTRDGRKRQVRWSNKVLHGEGGAAIGVLAIGHDITERLRLEKQVLEAATREQQRIAQDLHDGLGQELTGISFLAGVLREKLAAAGRAEAAEAAEIARLVGGSIAHARALVKGLRPVRLEEGGLAAAIEDLAETAREIHGIACEVSCAGCEVIEDAETAMHLYYIAREAVHNAVRHGRAGRITIRLSSDDGQGRLSIEDDGAGLPPESRRRGGSGLQIMAYRAHMIGGTFEVQRAGRRGTVARCSFPAAPAERAGRGEEG